jgi:hypothetical protein
MHRPSLNNGSCFIYVCFLNLSFPSFLCPCFSLCFCIGLHISLFSFLWFYYLHRYFSFLLSTIKYGQDLEDLQYPHCIIQSTSILVMSCVYVWLFHPWLGLYQARDPYVRLLFNEPHNPARVVKMLHQLHITIIDYK